MKNKPVLIEKPMSLNIYEFTNQLLGKTLEPKALLSADLKAELLKELQKKQHDLIKHQMELAKNAQMQEQQELAKANAEKIRRVIDTFSDDEKKKNYDEVLNTAPRMKIKTGDKDKENNMLVPLVSIGTITDEFDAFVKEMLAKKDANGNPLYTEADFKCETLEGPPKVYVFTFPNEECGNQFVDRLFSKNMAMLPSGSQSMDDVKQAQKKDLKENLKSMKEPEPEAHQPPTPSVKIK